MNTSLHHHPETCTERSTLAQLLLDIPPGRRGAALQAAVSFRPAPNLSKLVPLTRVRVAFVHFWHDYQATIVPIYKLRPLFTPPVPVITETKFTKMVLARTPDDIDTFTRELIDHLVSPLPT